MAHVATLNSISALAEQIMASRMKAPSHRALLVGVSGIDGSGKGFVTAEVEKQLRNLGSNIAALSMDDWHNLPNIRSNPADPAEYFYEHALRFTEMFKRLIIPLRDLRGVDVVANCGDAKATVLRKRRFEFRDIDIVLLEGIFIFKTAYRDHFDVKVWIDCSLKTALERAIERGQEGLPPAETRRDFERIYFPAQRLHLQRDQPREHADIIFDNDSAL